MKTTPSGPHAIVQPRSGSFFDRLVAQRYLVFLALPAVLVVFVFNYIPIYGIVISFQNFSVGRGVWGSPWVGLHWFERFFSNPLSGRLIRNTFLLGFLSLVITFPLPIILALSLNEIRSTAFKRSIQTISYLPYFISTVIIVGMLKDFSSAGGLFNRLIIMLGGDRTLFFSRPEWFRPLFIGSEVWQTVGWGSIIYLAALAGVDPQLYESAVLDGAGRWRQLWHITLPSILPTVSILFILRSGAFFAVDFQKVLLMYNPLTYETADIISTFVYREGIENARFSYSAAVGLLLSVMAFVFLSASNALSRRLSGNSLW